MSFRKTLLSAAGVAAGSYIGASAAMSISMGHRSRRIALNDTPLSVGMDYRDISFPSRRSYTASSVRLHGWMIPARGDGRELRVRESRWLVLVHGDGSNRADPQVGMMGLATDMNQLGYGILMFDLRGCGESEDGTFTAGWSESLDVLGALDCLVEVGADRSRIGVIGFSLGAVSSHIACSSPGVAAALVSDSAFADLWMMFKRSLQGGAFAAALMRPGLDFFLERLYGYRLSDVSPARSLAESDVPTMIVHGSSDAVIPPSHARELARACGASQAEIDSGDSDNFWMVAGAGHAQSYRQDPTGYVRRVSEFLDRHLAA